MKKGTEIAIIGMSGIFPGAGDLNTFWNNIENGVDAIQLVPENRMDAVFFGSEQPAVDRFYCRRGGFIDQYAQFDPVQFGILPLAVEGTEPEQLLALSQACKALADAGLLESEAGFDKTGIIIGKGNYTGPGATRAIEIVRTGEQIVQILQDLLPELTGADLEKVKKEFQQKKGRFTADTAMGLIPNLVASLIANRLNLGGTAYTLDAACASSLIAIDHAVTELTSRRADIMIAGGVHACQNAPFWSIFNQLGALSKNQQIRPFDQRADGLVIGEGCGFVVLKRLDDAIRDGHRIYAVIQGVGVSSDGAGASVMSPTVQGQAKAIRQAWEMAGISTEAIGYIEAHGTGTPLGDRIELETLAAVFGTDKSLPKAGIGTVKSMIGHAMPAAGIAGLIKTALALYHNKIPATIHCERPLEAMAQTRFRPVNKTLDWDLSELPKRAGVNAFGFGGINAHVVIEGYANPVASLHPDSGQLKTQEVEKDKVLLLARPTHQALLASLENNETETGTGTFRIAVFDPTADRIKKAVRIVEKNIPWRNRQDIWYTNAPLVLNGGKIAFLFSGLDGLTGGETESVARFFKLSKFESKENQTEDGVFNTAMKLLENSRILDSALKNLGVIPDLNAGHSLGEWLAGRSSGLASESSVLHLLTQLDPQSFEVKNTRFLAVGCGYEKLKPLLENKKDIYLSIDNCPQQVILCGTIEAVDDFVTVLLQNQIFHQILPFQSGFHSPFLEPKLDQLLHGMEAMDFQKTQIPLWSATTLETYPEEFEEIKALSIAHLIKPVRFRELTEKLYEQGARVFIQVGAGGLIGFIDDTLKGKTYSGIPSNTSLRSGIAQLQRVIAALFVEGKETDLSFLGIENKKKNAGTLMQLQLGSPFVSRLDSLKSIRFKSPVNVPPKELALSDLASPVMRAFSDNLNEITEIQNQVISLLNKRPIPVKPNSVTELKPDSVAVSHENFTRQLDISLENSPYLIDHSLLKQKPGWHCVEDMDPVIPMTMIFELFGEIALEHAPALLVRKIMNIKVFQWMNVVSPFKEKVTGTWKNPYQVYLDLDKYANSEVLLAKTYGTPETEFFDIGKSLGIKITPKQIYEENMFHGPAYQGIKEVMSVAENGITGIIESSSGKGSLLDNAGQLFGLWLQLTLDKDRIAFPVKIQEVEFYGSMSDQIGSFECTCQLTELTEEFASANFILKRNNQVWAIIRGWQNRRLEIDDKLWNVSMAPLYNILSEEVAPGIFLFTNVYQRVVSWDFILKRYFNQTEKKYQRALLPNKKKEYMISRVAVKDAVRMLLLKTKNEAFFPIEFEVKSDEAGRPFLYGDMVEGIQISLAHKNLESVAIARFGRPAGIDIEEIQPRGAGFNDIVFTASEISLLQSRENDEWVTRCWVAKEAYGKMLGKGLMGNPKAYIIEEIKDGQLRISDVWINTIKHKNYIIGWTS